MKPAFTLSSASILVLLAALCFLPRVASASDVRILVAIGNNVGDPNEEPLRFADTDARRVRDLFVELGDVAPERAFLLVNEKANVLRERLAEIKGRMSELSRAGHSIALILYVSSHASDGALHMNGTHLDLSFLRQYATEAAARLKLVIVDACQSGKVARHKGAFPSASFDVRLDQVPIRGEVFVTSSGPQEASQEWESLAGSLFTHHWLTGMRGDADANGDGEVTLSEAYAYAFRRTVSGASGTQGAQQHPVFDMNLAGSGDLVLARPSKGKGAIVFSAASSGNYVVSSQPRPDLVAEIAKTEGKTLRLAVPPGRYIVRKKLGRSIGLVALDLPYGGTAAVDESQMVRRDFAEVALKGGYIEQRPHTMLIGGRIESAPIRETGKRMQLSVGYRYAWDSYWAQIDASGGGKRSTLDTGRYSEQSMGLSLSAGYRILSAQYVLPWFGLRAEGIRMHQRLLRPSEEEIDRVFSNKPPERSQFGLQIGPALGMDIPIYDQFFTQGAVYPAVRYLPVDQQPDWTVAFAGAFALGWRF